MRFQHKTPRQCYTVAGFLCFNVAQVYIGGL